MEIDYEFIAKACHDANRAYCQSIGDNSQKPWSSTKAEIKNSAIDGVKYAIEMIEDGEDLSSAMMHENWLKGKIEQGWTYGEEKCEESKTHPCCIPYEQLPEEQKKKDAIFIDTVLTHYLDYCTSQT
ncbi:MAG: hypothetical protein MI685_09535, partial [Chlorobiales bacterium]|nr:hypothetical protein [Chlorobiales bacterium]